MFVFYYFFIYLVVYLIIYLVIYLVTCLIIYLFIRLSVYLIICISIVFASVFAYFSLNRSFILLQYRRSSFSYLFRCHSSRSFIPVIHPCHSSLSFIPVIHFCHSFLSFIPVIHPCHSSLYSFLSFIPVIHSCRCDSSSFRSLCKMSVNTVTGSESQNMWSFRTQRGDRTALVGRKEAGTATAVETTADLPADRRVEQVLYVAIMIMVLYCTLHYARIRICSCKNR